MKLIVGLFWTLFLATVIAQYSSSYILPSRIQVDQTEEGLLSDSGNQVGSQNGNDVIIAQPGTLDVILKSDKLAFEVCSTKCNGEFFACYEADPPEQNVTSFISDSCDTKCGFYVAARGEEISVNKLFSVDELGQPKLNRCDEIKMENSQTLFRDRTLPTCSPKIVNGMVKLTIVNTSSECPVVIKNAMINPKSTTPPSTSLGSTVGSNTVPGAQADATTEASSSVGDYWWAFLIAGILIVAIGIAILVFCLIKRRNRSKKATAAPRRKLRGSQSPIVARPSNESQPSHEAAAPPSYLSQSSIFSHKLMLLSKNQKQEQEKVAAATAETKEPEETDLTSVKPTA